MLRRLAGGAVSFVADVLDALVEQHGAGAPEALDGLRQRTMAALRIAELDGDFGSMGSMGRLLVAIEEHKRKIAPPPAVDPNELPDLVAAAEAAKKRMRAWLARRGAP